jgi:hypothetical protein
MVAAIKAKDLDKYAQCWYPARLDRESEVNNIKKDPTTWEELGAMFKGSLKLEETGERSEEGKTVKKFNVNSPDVENGIGAITMIKDGEKVANVFLVNFPLKVSGCGCESKNILKFIAGPMEFALEQG